MLALTAVRVIQISSLKSRPHEARSCRVSFVLALPAHWATSHEPLAVSQRCPSRPGLHLGVRTRSQRLVVLSPLPAVARFCRARPLTARAASSRPTHGASLPLPAIRAERRIRDGHLPSRRGTTASDEGDARPDKVRSRRYLRDRTRPLGFRRAGTPAAQWAFARQYDRPNRRSDPRLDQYPCRSPRREGPGQPGRERRRPTRSDRCPHPTWQGSHCFRLSKAFRADEESVLRTKLGGASWS